MLENKVAIVTGGANGMGEAIVRKFASEGAKVVIADTQFEKAKLLADVISLSGGVCEAFDKVDITHKGQVQSTVQETINHFGKIDILVNCAGCVLSDYGTSDKITMDDFNEVIDLILHGTMNMILEVLPFMKERKYGKIVNFTSMGVIHPDSVALQYHAAKGAIESITANLAFELATQGIYVNSIAPGAIKSPFGDKLMTPSEQRDLLKNRLAEKEIPLGRMGTVEDIAGVALFLSSSLSDFVTGEKIHVVGGKGNINSHNSSFLSSKENSVINK
ncbi:SDR family NAD(P)-dependent oxidoreductase [Lysinibacillus yapensis]|uniref:SDR family NAD(P)-dependent oxidoreductase n=1 Tax=Ureibacillus yapensis TaxID=2304605 RepID=UPI0011C3CC9C|nr:SDR family NAD(P)-dependent oxidoreductase [Lysinibacillus yapensis]